MGLDMYLYKKTFLKTGKHWEEPKRQTITIETGGVVDQNIKLERVSFITETVGEWRKANQIHNWFVDNVQEYVDDCKEHHVSIEQLEELLETCKKVVMSLVISKVETTQMEVYSMQEKKTVMEDWVTFLDTSIAEELLPTQSGFFFGSTDYDHGYLQDLEDTIEILETVLSEDNDMSDFYYQSSW
jgi:hypothetical protein